VTSNEAISALQAADYCHDTQMKSQCPGYTNVIMFCCPDSHDRSLNDLVCEGYTKNENICGTPENMEKTVQSCCTYEYLNKATHLHTSEVPTSSPAATAPTASIYSNAKDETCVSISASANDFWCQTKCAGNGAKSCPPALCKCGSSAGQQQDGTAPAAAATAEAPAARYTPQSDVTCKSVSASANDYWCQTVCPTGNCPATLCKCGAEASPSPLPAAALNLHADGSIYTAPKWLSSNSTCKSLSPATNDYWCNLKCGGGGKCPEKLCRCGDDLGQQQQLADTETPEIQNVGAPTDPTCVSISPSANDYWCQTNCATGGCPGHLCKCGDKAEASPSPLTPPSRLAVGLSARQHEEHEHDRKTLPDDVPTVFVTGDGRKPEPTRSITGNPFPAESTICVSISSSATDDWCATTCATGPCPREMCECEQAKHA
jgi:hypothetical protein